MNQAASFSLTTLSNRRSMAYAFEARGSLCSPLAMREMVPCGTPVSSLIADCVQPIRINSEIFSDVFMSSTIRTRIGYVNTLSHYSFANNDLMEFRDWLQAEMDARGLDPSKLARMSKVPQPTIFRILSGETRDPRTGTVKKLEFALRARSPDIEPKPIPDTHRELLEAWDYLLPGEQQDILNRIRPMAARNKEAATRFQQVVRVADRRKRQVSFTGLDRRQNRGSSNEE